MSYYAVIEGVDGAGKTAVSRRVVELLVESNLSARYTREPGGTPFSESVRTLVLNDPSSAKVPAFAKALLFAASSYPNAKAQYSGIIVSDRWAAVSSRVYQLMSETDRQEIENVNSFWEFYVSRLGVAGTTRKPNVIFWLSIDPQLAYRRATARSIGTDNTDDGRLHSTVRRHALYAELLSKNNYGIPIREQRLDENTTVEELAQAIVNAIISDLKEEQLAAAGATRVDL